MTSAKLTAEDGKKIRYERQIERHRDFAVPIEDIKGGLWRIEFILPTTRRTYESC